jgi:hypothetical protein
MEGLSLQIAPIANAFNSTFGKFMLIPAGPVPSAASQAKEEGRMKADLPGLRKGDSLFTPPYHSFSGLNSSHGRSKFRCDLAGFSAVGGGSCHRELLDGDDSKSRELGRSVAKER